MLFVLVALDNIKPPHLLVSDIDLHVKAQELPTLGA